MPKTHLTSLKKLPHSNIDHIKWDREAYDKVYNKVYDEEGDWGRFTLDHSRLYFNNKEVVMEHEIEQKLIEFYSDLQTGFRGRDIMFQRISEKYLGISFNDVNQFVKSLEIAQLSKRPRKPVIIRPLRISQPNRKWQIDLIDMRGVANDRINHGFVWILTCVDVFTKKVRLEGAKRKSSFQDDGEVANVYSALKSVLTRIPAHERPSVIQSDNGKEFKSEVENLLKEYGIKHVFSDAYKPTSQSVVERMNQTVKGMIRRVFVANGNHSWYVHLSDIEANINDSIQSKTGLKANEIASDPNKIEFVKTVISNDADKVLARRGVNINKVMKDFQPGRKVRITIKALQRKGAISQEELKQSKAELRSYWSKEIYTIHKVYKDGRVLLRDYFFRNSKGARPVFTSNELQVIPDILYTADQFKPQSFAFFTPREREEVENPREEVDRSNILEGRRERKPNRLPNFIY